MHWVVGAGREKIFVGLRLKNIEKDFGFDSAEKFIYFMYFSWKLKI